MDLGGSEGLIPPHYQGEPDQIVTKSISFLLHLRERQTDSQRQREMEIQFNLIFLVEIDLLKISMSM